ncbi:hypothetical protein D1AOALGA4SA_8638 [Olavius algarvensis Delta 1 endosymbiont]|nr:hypothetical protein D1AOALGA4SA_8638 [Olavius algarvensis Delta 1 endosymbiont]
MKSCRYNRIKYLRTRQSIVLSRHAALRAAYSGRFLLFDIIIR